MNKEQIKDKIKEFVNYAREEEEGVTDDDIYMFMDDVFPQGDGGRWVFKTDKLTPLQVKACVCQQCPFPGELGTKCDWCDNPKMMEFLRLALSAIDDFYQQHEANALKEQRERIQDKIDKSYLYLRSLCLAPEDDGDLARGYDIAMNEALSELATLKAELGGEGLVLEHGCRHLSSEFECEKRLLIKGKCPSDCIYYDDGSR